MKTLTVNVSKEIINSSNPCDVHRCMIAEAIQAKYKTAKHVYVDTTTIRLTYRGLRHWFIPPTSVKNFIVAFDKGQKPKPFQFTTAFLAKTIPEGYRSIHKWRGIKKKSIKPKRKLKAAMKRVRVNGICNLVPRT